MRTLDEIFFDFEEIKTSFQKMNQSIKLSKKFDSFFHPTFEFYTMTGIEAILKKAKDIELFNDQIISKMTFGFLFSIN